MLRFLAALVALIAITLADVSAQPFAANTFYVNDRYDPRANPYQDLERAIELASAQNKRILIVVGGDWCIWCEILDRHLASNANVRADFERSFVILKVYFGRENQNAAFLSGFPQPAGYPDFLILDARGGYLGQQRTDALESGRGYDPGSMRAFARRWLPDD